TRRHPEPADAVEMHDERRVAAKRFVAAFLLIALRIGTLRLCEVGNVVAAPLPFRVVPPHEFLPLAPRRSVRRGGAAVVEDAPIERPGVSPSVTISAARLALERFVLAVVYAGVNPAAATRAAIRLEIAEVFDRRARGMRDEG